MTSAYLCELIRVSFMDAEIYVMTIVLWNVIETNVITCTVVVVIDAFLIDMWHISVKLWTVAIIHMYNMWNCMMCLCCWNMMLCVYE